MSFLLKRGEIRRSHQSAALPTPGGQLGLDGWFLGRMVRLGSAVLLGFGCVALMNPLQRVVGGWRLEVGARLFG